jgi:hypothetical protein
MAMIMQWPVLFFITLTVVIGAALIAKAFDKRTGRRFNPPIQIERRRAANDNQPMKKARGGLRWL